MTSRSLPTPEALRRILAYDADTGKLSWLVDHSSRAKAGQVAGSFDPSRGYTRVVIGGTRMAAHRVAWAIHNGAWPLMQIDHIDGDGANNAIKNLRIATASQNQQNRAASSSSRSGIVGVSWDSTQGGRAAVITVHGKVKRLGVYASKESAARAYRIEKARLHLFHPTPVERSITSARGRV